MAKSTQLWMTSAAAILLAMRSMIVLALPARMVASALTDQEAILLAFAKAGTMAIAARGHHLGALQAVQLSAVPMVPASLSLPQRKIHLVSLVRATRGGKHRPTRIRILPVAIPPALRIQRASPTSTCSPGTASPAPEGRQMQPETALRAVSTPGAMKSTTAQACRV